MFDAEALTRIDARVAALEQTIVGVRAEGITFTVARMKGPMRTSFDSAGLAEKIGEPNLFPTVRAAVDAFSGAR